MIRNLKVLIAAAMALAAFGAFGASGAQAAEFHCSVTPCVLTPNLDGTAKNSHHVFIVKQGETSVSTTCNQITGDATFEGKTTSSITFTGVAYDVCTVAGAESEVKMNGCDYLFTSNGQVHLICPKVGEVQQKIEIVVKETGCTITVGEQTLEGVGYKTASPAVTLSTNVLNIAATVANDKCTTIKLNPGAATGEYTTGNTLVNAETEGKVSAEAWFE